jgi:hypothetical protein
MEFLRFGSRIAGTYWGCCAIDIIQNFKVDPDAKASTQLVSGDSGAALGDKYLGPTYRDIFLNRLRIGTFGSNDMPNHIFLASLDSDQIRGEIGKKWLAILKDSGFEFIRATDNSVYSGSSLNNKSYRGPVYLFGLFRNIGKAAVPDPFKPPKEWTDLPEQTKPQEEMWKAGKTVILTAKQLIEAGAPVMKSGTMGEKPKDITNEIKTPKAQEKGTAKEVVAADPFTIEPLELTESELLQPLGDETIEF